MSKTARRQDDIEYVEYYLRKTIQHNSLRTPKQGNQKSRQQVLDPKKNFGLFLNKQTALLREGQPKNTSIRDLYSKNQHSKDVILFPNFISTPKESPNHRKLFSLQANDPLIKKVMDHLEDDVPKDFIYAETPAANQKKQVVKETKNELSVDKKIKFAILDQIDEKDLRNLYKKFADQTAMEKLRDFRKDRITKQFPMATFYTALPEQEEEAPSSEQERVNHLLGHHSTLNTYIRQKLDGTTDKREKKVIENLCYRYDLNTERLLQIDPKVGHDQKASAIKSMCSLDNIYESDDIEKAKEEIAQRAREYEDYQYRTRTLINTFYKFESNQNTIGDKRTIQRLRTINWEFLKSKGPESYQRKRAVMKELKHLQDQRFEIIDILKDMGRERDRGKLENEYEIPQINIQQLNRNLHRIDMIYNGMTTPEKTSTYLTPREGNSTLNSPRVLTSPRTIHTAAFNSLHGQKSHRRTLSNVDAPISPQSPQSANRGSVASIRSSSTKDLKPLNTSRMNLKVEAPSFVKSPSRTNLENSGQVSTKAFDSKYFSTRNNSQRNSEMKNIIDNWNEFCEKIKKVSDIQKMDSDYLHKKLPKFSSHVQKVYDKIEEQHLHEFEIENKDFNTFKEEKRFKNKLIDCMMAKIKNKHAFVNVLENRNREKKEETDMMQFLAYNFDLKSPSKLGLKSPKASKKNHLRTSSMS